MEIKAVNEVLKENGFLEPRLNVLTADEAAYKVLLFQPSGDIRIDHQQGVRHADAGPREQFAAAIRKAAEVRVDVFVTPEYSTPWDTLITEVQERGGPDKNKIWILGCESISFAALKEMKKAYSGVAHFIFEDLTDRSGNFVDPLVYVFRAALKDGNEKTVFLVQFKTFPMGDTQNFEVDHLIKGRLIYQFGVGQAGLRLASIICSDAFAITDLIAKSLHDRSLIVHIQLNQNPRHLAYREYRDRLLGFKHDQTEVLCLNWAANVVEREGQAVKQWNNIGGSAWYVKSNEFDAEDATLNANHKRGLYYTWLDGKRAHALFLNYQAALFEITASKVAHIGVEGPIGRRRGPQLSSVYTWDVVTRNWSVAEELSDGFEQFNNDVGVQTNQLVAIAKESPLAAERILALCAGRISGIDWFEVGALDSCRLDSAEIIRRATFCQDTNADAKRFKTTRLNQFAHLWSHLASAENIPVTLPDFRRGFRLDWNGEAPHQNVISTEGNRATLVNLGDSCTATEAKRTAQKLAHYLHKATLNGAESERAVRRLAVWYRDTAGQLKLHQDASFYRFDEPNFASADFTVPR